MFKEKLNKLIKFIINEICDLGNNSREGELIKVLEDNGYLIKLPVMTHINNIIMTFDIKFPESYNHEFVIFL